MNKKIEFDKYYTSKELAQYCYDKVINLLGKDNISEIIEPSAGSGVFLDCDLNMVGYDIAPEDSRIIQQDFLNLKLEYKKGRLVLGNPPYGRCLHMAQKFFKKSIELCDYIAFILPISQLNNTLSLFEYDLIYSEDLGIQRYSDIKLHCVFNIYKRPINGLHTRKRLKVKGIKIIRQDNKKYDDFEYDIRICYWGNTIMGKILNEEDRKYAGEYKIVIDNELELKPKIITYIKEFNWNKYIKGIAMKRLKQSDIYSVLLEKFPLLQEEG